MIEGSVLNAKKYKIRMINYFKENNISLNRILVEVFNQKILRIKYLGYCPLKCVPEYRFYLLKFNVVLEDFSNYIVFIKLTSKNKIQESLFCYWMFYEEYHRYNTSIYNTKANIMNIEQKEYEDRYKLQIHRKNKKIMDNAYVNIINLYKYKKLKLDKNISKDSKYLFIATAKS